MALVSAIWHAVVFQTISNVCNHFHGRTYDTMQKCEITLMQFLIMGFLTIQNIFSNAKMLYTGPPPNKFHWDNSNCLFPSEGPIGTLSYGTISNCPG